MTELQYKRFKDFARRMAATVFGYSKRPSTAWIVAEVNNWIDLMDYDESWRGITDWDGGEDPLCDAMEIYYDVNNGYYPYMGDATDDVCDIAYEQYSEQWLGPIRCCIRASVGTSCGCCGGVIGFNAGHIRAMYPEGVPDWVSGGTKKWHSIGGEKHSKVTFADMLNNTPIVL